MTAMKRVIVQLFSVLCAGPALAVAAATTTPATAPAIAPAVPARTEITTMDTWQVTCLYDKDNHKLGCNAVLRVTQPGAPATDKEPSRPARVFMVWALSKANNGSVYSSFQTLTGVRVQPGLQLKLDSAAPRTIPFDSCGTSSCLAIAAMDPDFLKQAKGVTQIQATVQSADGKAYTATFAPKGLDRAILAVL
jgi:invasion protein IalB